MNTKINTKIKKILSYILITALVMMTAVSIIPQGTSAATQDYEQIFEKDKVIDINIDISQEDLASIYANPQLEEYHSANITVDGVSVENVGIRTKGNSSLNSVTRSESDRYSFRIKFNKYVKGQKLLGLDEMVINNMFSDASYMREYLSYEAMREMGLDVPLAVMANIYINGELKGFYLCVEAIEDSFLDREFGNNDGNLYKQEQGSTLVYKEGNEYVSSELKVGADTEKTALKNMIKVLNEKGDYESVLDVDSALRFIAANTVLGSYDSYNGQFAHNYYLYEQDGKFTVIPWDYNMSFGGFGQGGSGWAISIDTPVSGVSMDSRPLINNLLEVAQYKERYLEYIKQFAKYLENLPARVDELASVIRPYIEADPTKFVTMEQFENSIKYMEETERTSTQGQGGMRISINNGGETIIIDGIDMETMNAAMEIMRSAGTGELTVDQIEQLKALGLTDEQIIQLKKISANAPQGGNPPQGGRGGNVPPDGQGGGQRGQGGMGGIGGMGGMDREVINAAMEIIRLAGTGELTDDQISQLKALGLTDEQIVQLKNMAANVPDGQGQGGMMPPDGQGQPGGQRPQGGMGGGMGGGSIITYATKRLENINTQLNGGTAPSPAPSQEISVYLNSKKISFDVAPVIENDRTLVPVRAIFEALGMAVEYSDGEITATKDELTIKLTVGSNIAYVNDTQVTLDVASKIINDRTLVPLRFIGEATGLVVSYNAADMTVNMENR